LVINPGDKMKKILLLALANIMLISSATFADMHSDNKRVITKAEYIKHAEERFMKMDTNKDGKLTPEERKAFHQVKKPDVKK
jgi:hypothetical protein